MEAANQNQKFPFHFLSAPPIPRRKSKEGRKIFGFVPRPKGADETRLVRFLFKIGSRIFKQRAQEEQSPERDFALLVRGRGFESYRFGTAFPFPHAEAARKYGRSFSSPLSQGKQLPCSAHTKTGQKPVWLCAGEDLNLHARKGLRTSSVNVYQFRHPRIIRETSSL